MLLLEHLYHMILFSPPVSWIDYFYFFSPYLTAPRMPFYGAEDDLEIHLFIGMLSYAELS